MGIVTILWKKNTLKIIDISITPNRSDCLGIRGIARDLAASGFGELKKKDTGKKEVMKIL